jgi:hypothetical protein
LDLTLTRRKWSINLTSYYTIILYYKWVLLTTREAV